MSIPTQTTSWNGHASEVTSSPPASAISVSRVHEPPVKRTCVYRKEQEETWMKGKMSGLKRSRKHSAKAPENVTTIKCIRKSKYFFSSLFSRKKIRPVRGR